VKGNEGKNRNFSLVFVAQLFILLFYPLHSLCRIFIVVQSRVCAVDAWRSIGVYFYDPTRSHGDRPVINRKLPRLLQNFVAIAVAIKAYYVHKIVPTITDSCHSFIGMYERITHLEGS